MSGLEHLGLEAEQERVDEALRLLALTFRARSTGTAFFWRQVPLLCVVADGRSGWLGAWSEAASTARYPFSSAGGAGLRFRCSDGVPLAWNGGDGDREAGTDYVLRTAADASYRLQPWDGRYVLSRMLDAASKPATPYRMTLPELHAQWKDTIAQHRVGLVAGWEELDGPLHDVSEIFVGLASSWEGSVGTLLRASVELAGAEGAEELSDVHVLGLGLDL